MEQCFGSRSLRIRIIWPDPFQKIRTQIGVLAPKTYQNHEKKLSLTGRETKLVGDWLVFSGDSSNSLFLLHFELYSNIVYKNIAKHLIGKTRFAELKLPRIRIKIKRIRKTDNIHPSIGMELVPSGLRISEASVQRIFFMSVQKFVYLHCQNKRRGEGREGGRRSAGIIDRIGVTWSSLNTDEKKSCKCS